jgi:hypothetical protein
MVHKFGSKEVRNTVESVEQANRSWYKDNGKWQLNKGKVVNELVRPVSHRKGQNNAWEKMMTTIMSYFSL